MKDSQQQQQPQPLKFIQVSNVKKKPVQRKKYYPTKSNKRQQGSNKSSTSNQTCSQEGHSQHEQASHSHVLSTTTCSSSSLSRSILHGMGSSEVNYMNGNNDDSTSSLDASSSLHMLQQHPTSNSKGPSLHVFNNNTLDETSKYSDSSSVGIEHCMHGRNSTSSPASNMLSTSINNNSNNIHFVMEASPKYITHVAKKRNTLAKDNLIKVLHLSQVQACRVLGCSLSTLKRRFGEVKQELGMEKWPSYYDDVRHLPIFPKLYPMSLQFIMNEHDCSDLPQDCNLIFEHAAQLSSTFPKPLTSPED